MSDCDHEVCLTCGDVATEMRVVRIDGATAVVTRVPTLGTSDAP